jgi:hypothetical protein
VLRYNACVYEYNARLIRVVDGDTYEFEVDLGFGMFARGFDFRLVSVDCPELSTPAGKLASEFVDKLLRAQKTPFRIHTMKMVRSDREQQEKWRRYLVEVDLNSDEFGIAFKQTLPKRLSDYLVERNFAKPYDGKGPRP